MSPTVQGILSPNFFPSPLQNAVSIYRRPVTTSGKGFDVPVSGDGVREGFLPFGVHGLFHSFPVCIGDKFEDLVAAHFFYGAGDEMPGQELPCLPHFREKGFYIRADGALVLFVGLGEDQGKRDLPFSEAIDEFEIELLWGVAAVDEDEDMDEVFAFAEIILDHLLPFLSLALRHFGKPVAGEIDHIPRIIDVEMVDELRLSGRAGGLGQAVVESEHIDHRGFTDVAATDKSIFRSVGCGALRKVGAADHV